MAFPVTFSHHLRSSYDLRNANGTRTEDGASLVCTKKILRIRQLQQIGDMHWSATVSLLFPWRHELYQHVGGESDIWHGM